MNPSVDWLPGQGRISHPVLVAICILDRLEHPLRAIFDRGPKTGCLATPTVLIDSVRRPRGESPVKKIEAFIRHEAFEPIRSELLDKGFPSLSIFEVKGSGRHQGLVQAAER
jgi:Nitrogen regulatory protein P-II